MICTHNQNKSNKPKSIGSLLLFFFDIIVILNFCTQFVLKDIKNAPKTLYLQGFRGILKLFPLAKFYLIIDTFVSNLSVN